MTRKITASRLTFVFLSLALVIFFAIVSGGCVGGSSKRSVDNPDNPPQPSVFDEVLDDNILDSDGDGVPDVLDFNDIDQKYYGRNDLSQKTRISSIPSRHYLRGLENSASFSADLTAGTEYTIEISESAGISGIQEVADYAYPIGDNIIGVEVLNPQGETLRFLDLGTFDASYDARAVIDLSDDMIELSVYPPENPYMICHTFTPSVTGTYTINLSRVNLYDSNADAEVASAEDDFEHVPTMFIYKELRDGTERNEAGHYKRYVFEDEDGNTTSTISMTDIMALRKAYNDIMYDTLSAAWKLDGANGETENVWKRIIPNSDAQAQVEAYFKCFHLLKEYYGIFTSEDVQVNTKQIVNGEVSGDEYDEVGEWNTVSSNAENASVVSPAASGQLNAKGTTIKQELYGIPYTDDFQPGVGYFAVTGIQATRNAVRRFRLPPLDPDNPDKKYVKSKYVAQFVSSQEDREKISTETTGASLAIGGFGLGASYSSTSKFKFGLTSVTFVIHYEEVENAYRVLNDGDYKLRANAGKTLSESIPRFRANYGDYFVGGYKYGGTYDAFITITTQTIEQLEKVKSKFSASFVNSDTNVSNDFSISANVGKETEETIKNNNATVSIQIITAGIDVSNIPEIPNSQGKLDMNNVVQSLNAFRTALKKSKHSDYMPVYVMLKRYSLLDEYDEEMDRQKDSGLVPITPAHSQKIMDFNKQKLIMDSYYNVISDLTNQQIDGAIRDSFTKECTAITNEITIGGNSFYAESNSARMDELKEKMEDLSDRLKALGDRYVFYHVLVAKQKWEKSYSPSSIQYKPFGYQGGSVGTKTFNVSTAVTSDIAAGRYETFSRQEGAIVFGTVKWGFGMEACSSNRALAVSDGHEYVFCWAGVTAKNEHDNRRDVLNPPLIGSKRVTFQFESGGTRTADWKVSLQCMRFDRAMYPFFGLD